MNTEDTPTAWKSVSVDIVPKNEARAVKRIAPLLNERGFFQFSEVDPGVYRLSVFANGFSSLERDFTVHEGREILISEPLLLTRPRQLQIAINPPTDPWQQPWRAELSKFHNETVAEAGSLVAGEDGKASFTELASGRYQLRIGRGSTTWMSHNFDLSDDRTLVVDVPLTKIAGRVILGGAPLPCILWFGGEGGERSIKVVTRDDGTFRTILPAVQDDTWDRIDVLSEDPFVRRKLVNVRLTGTSGIDHRRMDLELPDHAIAGEVIDQDGRPITRAASVRVRTTSDESLLDVPVSADGMFLIRGLEPGLLRLRAVAAGAQSEMVEVALEERTAQRPFVHLALRGDDVVEGIVISGERPLAGARVFVVPDDTAVFTVAPRITDSGGRFRVPVPHGVRNVRVFVSTAGFGARVVRHSLGGDPLMIALSAVSGTLQILFPLEGKKSDVVSQLAIRVHEVDLSLKQMMGFLARPSVTEENGIARLTFRELEEGEYRLCRAGRCTAAYLPRLGHATLRAPAED